MQIEVLPSTEVFAATVKLSFLSECFGAFCQLLRQRLSIVSPDYSMLIIRNSVKNLFYIYLDFVWGFNRAFNDGVNTTIRDLYNTAYGV